MSEPTPSAPPRGAEARPVDVSERVTLLDVLRGFALCGVFVSNSFSWFSGRVLLPREQAQALAAPPLETVVSSLYSFFVNQKFVTLFSFLFGLGFSIQLTRAQARGVPIVPLYSRRLLVLLGIGVTHIFALWVGDVLSTYAVVGFALLLFYQRSDRTLLAWVFVLMVAVPLVVPAIQRFGPILLHGAQAAAEAAKASESQEAQEKAQFLAGLSSGSFWTTQEANARYYVDMFFRVNRLLWMSVILGRFLLGLLAGRHLLLQDVERHRPLHRRLLIWGLVLGVLGNGTGLVMQRLRIAGLVDPAKDSWMFVMSVIQEVGYLGLAAVYVAAFALLFQRERWRRVMQVLAPVGRMALTNYLLETVVSLCIYDGWGLGLVGRMPPSSCVAVSLAVFALQVPLSHWWLSRFRFGPAEWLWRSLTYGRAQPMRLAPRGAAAPAAS
ncbi:DUF418 domain-containing protein [Vitiosangium sp. GDMCC 1.1324]|uniref:DUF418 domain-containing protein n=1 Tax=Vitiosangium sp. (strain GDMCC 1.1324) TaxID=2138576 RepID=UPI000D39BD81|nr:DUF418 domain-containing protein [Vitiosangium sp. GDMCC 1.1324]PTL75117.1 DUF418 domain-containing protein [Vitiosangium sp. GDMCC 1.1324]